MAMNFMEAGTEIESIIADIEKKKSNIALIVSKAIVDRAKQGKINKSLSKDIDSLLKNLSVEEKYNIMLSVAYYLANSNDYSNTPTVTTNKKKKEHNYEGFGDDFFSRRGF